MVKLHKNIIQGKYSNSMELLMKVDELIGSYMDMDIFFMDIFCAISYIFHNFLPFSVHFSLTICRQIL